MTGSERLYTLLPAIYRQRDVAQGEPLRALCAVLEHELTAIVADLDTTWDNWFVETCEEWVLPYIGRMLGLPALRSLDAFGFSQRAYVANTLAYRRRKGTAAVVEQLAFDLTGHRARAVEYFRHVVVTQHVKHARGSKDMPAMGGTVDVREARRLEAIDGPFDPHAHLADVRPMSRERGRYNLPNLGVHLWRIASFEVTRSTARPFAGEVGWYRFDPHGVDVPLFNVPRTETDITSLAEPIHVPHPLSRLELHAELVGDVPSAYLGLDPAGPDAAFEVRIESAGVIGDPLAVEICNLADTPTGLPAHVPPADTVSVDPELGRLVLAPENLPPAVDEPFEVLVDYAYGAPADVGAGTFDRTAAHELQLGGDAVTWTRYVSRHPVLAAEVGALTTLEDAVAAWNAHVAVAGAGAVGRIVLTGGRTRPDLPSIAPQSRIWLAPVSVVQLPEGTRLHIIAAGVDIEPDGVGGQVERVVPHRTRATIVGDVTVVGGIAVGEEARPGGLFLNGLSIEGRLIVGPGDLEHLDMAHCTVVPDAGGIDVESAPAATNAALQVRLYRSVCGPIAAAGETTGLALEGAIVQGGPLAIDMPGTAVAVDGSTILGGVVARTLESSNSIFDGSMQVEQHQQGCLRFCWTRSGEHGPRRYRCQPDLAVEGVTHPELRARIAARLQPMYVAESFGQPGFGLLAPATPVELRTGAEDGAEMGAFHHLQFSRRESNLRHALRQYLRFGLEADLLIES